MTQYNYIQNTFAPNDFFQGFPVSQLTSQSEAVFGDVTIPVVWINGLRLRLGLRETHEAKSSDGSNTIGIVSTGALLAPPVPTSGEESITKLTWKVGLDYDISPTNLLYATASNGFKSGGINNLPPEAAALSTYKPEFITAEEVGSKNRFFDDRLQVNAALFRYAYKNYQAYEFWRPLAALGAPPSIANGTFFPTVNSQRATFQGAEFNVKWRATSADTVSLAVNLLNNTFDEFNVALPFNPPFDLSNTPVFLSPKRIFQPGYEHTFTMPNDDALALSASSQVVSSQVAQGSYSDGVNSHEYTQAGYHKTNANLSYRTAKGGWTVNAYIRNIENSKVVNIVAAGYPIPENFSLINYRLDPPRTFGFNIRKEF